MNHGMQPDAYFNSVVHMLHVATQSALSVATMTFGAKAALPLTHLGQLLNAIHNTQWDAAERALAKLKESLDG